MEEMILPFGMTEASNESDVKWVVRRYWGEERIHFLRF